MLMHALALKVPWPDLLTASEKDFRHLLKTVTEQMRTYRYKWNACVAFVDSQ